MSIMNRSKSTCAKCEEETILIDGVWIHSSTLNTNCEFEFRNYNIGKTITENTEEFEKELSSLVSKYDCDIETESF